MWNAILLILAALCGIGYLFIKKRYSHWIDKGVPHDNPIFPFGSLKGVGSKMHISQMHRNLYKQFKGTTPFVGIFSFLTPAALVLDIDLVKNILVKDFNYFVNRGVYFNEVDDPLTGHIFALEDNKWRTLRAKLTPTFTSGKMKYMFPTIVTVAEEFTKCINKEIEKDHMIEMKDILARFTTDVIGTCAFGLECNSLVDPEAKFREMGRTVFKTSPIRMARMLFLNSFREVGRKLHMKSIKQDVSDFYMKAVVETIEYREKNNIKRNDFMDLLIKLKNEGYVDHEHGKIDITINEIAAQAFVFFLAGFETSSTTMSYALYELSLNDEIQERGRQEVKRVLEKYDGKMTYEAVSEMKYIDQIINESLRKYPPGTALMRTASMDYKVPGTNHILEKGSLAFIPVYSIQHDPEYYPDPEKFDPDRFTDEKVQKRNPYTFMPFGEGPRNCIGLRFGMMQARIGVATLLQNYKFSKCSKSIIPLNFLSHSQILTPDGGLWLNVERI